MLPARVFFGLLPCARASKLLPHFNMLLSLANN
jgi:hypothetical protein